MKKETPQKKKEPRKLLKYLKQTKPDLYFILVVIFTTAIVSSILTTIALVFILSNSEVDLSRFSLKAARIQASQNEVNSENGYELPVSYGDIGPKMIASGVIDLEKFKKTLINSNENMTDEELNILTKGSDKKIKITKENSHFLLNFFWAMGINNKNRILTEGDIVKYAEGNLAGYASTGGWTLTKSNNPMDYYSKENLANLSPNQQELLEKVSKNIYRPCCNNSTYFPDCNHGMALLGILELMASKGVNEDQMYETSKYINGYWFPDQYSKISLYFQLKSNKRFKDIDPKVILGKEFSSSSGYQSTLKWLDEKNALPKAPSSGKSKGAGCST